MDGWVDGWESRVKDCLQQSKTKLKQSGFGIMGPKPVGPGPAGFRGSERDYTAFEKWKIFCLRSTTVNV